MENEAMKAIILAAGKGVRMQPLTLKTPKPLLKVNDKPIIDYILESFPPEIDEVIIVVKYLAAQIKRYLGKKNPGMKIKYVWGSDKGSAYSFIATKKHLKNERFLVVNGDELTDFVDITNCLSEDLSILVFRQINPRLSGMANLRKDGSIRKIIEKPDRTKSILAVNGVMVLNTDIFNYTPELTKGEFYFSSMINHFARDHKLFPVKLKRTIIDIGTPNDLIRAGNTLKSRSNIDGQGNNQKLWQ